MLLITPKPSRRSLRGTHHDLDGALDQVEVILSDRHPVDGVQDSFNLVHRLFDPPLDLHAIVQTVRGKG